MRAFENLNPLTVAFYYAVTLSIAMFTMNPILHVAGFIGGILQFAVFNRKKTTGTHLYFFIIGSILALVRPVFSHNGVTVLFVVNDNPITLESFIFGINSAVMVVGVLYLFRVISVIFTSDRFLYLFGAFSPKTALVMSAGLRFIPLLRRRYRMIGMAQTVIGINKDDNVIDRMGAAAKTMSATVTWGLENGIITAESMAARYFGTGKRSRYALFKFGREDLYVVMTVAVLSVIPVVCLFKGDFDTVFYPEFLMNEPDIRTVLGYLCYGVIILIPVIMKVLENYRWKFLRSRI
ncbi:MAG: energy-coupling factor transporter transmembrane protein EcfT [Lachnospiraceae bacterium]|nr:energy-coupling factor transporter transmembrane protein EcfT [Lachnospiraceae bacterium]